MGSLSKKFTKTLQQKTMWGESIGGCTKDRMSSSNASMTSVPWFHKRRPNTCIEIYGGIKWSSEGGSMKKIRWRKAYSLNESRMMEHMYRGNSASECLQSCLNKRVRKGEGKRWGKHGRKHEEKGGTYHEESNLIGSVSILRVQMSEELLIVIPIVLGEQKAIGYRL